MAVAEAKSRAAAEAEVAAVRELSAEKPRTYGILTVSAAALFFKAKAFREAEAVAKEALSMPFLPEFAQDQLLEIQRLAHSRRLRFGQFFRCGETCFCQKLAEQCFNCR
jgi:hypothetical protein